MGVAMEYWDLWRHPNPNIIAVWQKSAVVKFDGLYDGIYGTNLKGVWIIHFIPFNKILLNKNITYKRFVIGLQPQKEDTHFFRLKVGGNIFEYPHNKSTPNFDIITSKTHCNSFISAKEVL